MWLFTQDGFYSIVAENERTVVVRARVEKDLVRLIQHSKILKGTVITRSPSTRDYQYRIKINKTLFAEILYEEVKKIKYDNFKDYVMQKLGEKRERLYESVWLFLKGNLNDMTEYGEYQNEEM